MFGASPRFALSSLAGLSAAAYSDSASFGGWTRLTGDDLGLGPLMPGATYEASGSGGLDGQAAVFRQDDRVVVAFRGSDSPLDVLEYERLRDLSYVTSFAPLLEAVRDYAEDESIAATDIALTGHSLGGGAVNQMRDLALAESFFGEAVHVAFAAPNIAAGPEMLNIGFENDSVFKAISGRQTDFVSSTDNFVWVHEDYAGDPQGGTRPHAIANHLDALDRLEATDFAHLLDADDLVLVLAETVATLDLGDFASRLAAGDRAVVLGNDAPNLLAGLGAPAAARYFWGGEGDDTLVGQDAADRLEGGMGDDDISGGAGDDLLIGDGGAAEIA